MFHYLKCLIILSISTRSQGKNLVILANEKGFFQPCDPSDNFGNHNVENFMQLNLRHDFADDMETLITNGNITVNIDTPENTLVKFSMEVLAWKRGEWVQTLLSMRRDDFCSALFNPSELWYSISNTIPPEDRVCPPKKDTTYHIHNLENRIELQDVNTFGFQLEGQYKAVTVFTVGSYSTCISSIVDVWKN